MDYETARITLELDAPTFELVYEALRSFMNMIETAKRNGDELPTRMIDQYNAVKELKFQFNNGVR